VGVFFNDYHNQAEVTVRLNSFGFKSYSGTNDNRYLHLLRWSTDIRINSKYVWRQKHVSKYCYDHRRRKKTSNIFGLSGMLFISVVITTKRSRVQNTFVYFSVGESRNKSEVGIFFLYIW